MANASSLRKRIAAVAVTALGLGMLTATPSFATAAVTDQPTVKAGSTSVVRSGSSGDAVITFTPGAAFASGDRFKVTVLTRNGVDLTAVPAGISLKLDATNAGVASANTLVSAATAARTEAVLTINATTAPGKYTYSAVGGTSSTYGTAVTGTFYVSGAPATVAFSKAAYTAESGANAAAKIAITDASGYPTYLKTGEAVQVASSSTSATSSVVLLDSGNYTQTEATAEYVSTNLSASAAGSYTFTVSGAGGVTVASATTTLTVVAAPINATTAVPKSGQSFNLSGSTNYVSTAQTTVTLAIANTTPGTKGSFKVAISQTSGVPFPGGVAAKTDYVTSALNAAEDGREATYSITTTSALAGTGYTVTVNGVSAFDVLYQAPVAYNIARSISAASTIAAVKLATTSVNFTVKDQFGNVFPGAVVTYTTGGRNTVAAKTAVTDASGVVSVSTTDAAASTSTADDDVTATVPAVTVTGAASQTRTATTTIKYYSASAIAVGTVGLAVTQPGTPGTTATYSATITTSTSPSVTVDTNLANANDESKIADQIKIVATVSDADGNAIQGLPVTVSGTSGTYFLAGGTIGDVALVGQTGAKTSLAGYSDASGQYTFQASFVTAGTSTITVTSGGVSKTYSIKVVAGARGIVSATASGATVTATVTDLRGNVVSGATVTFTAASGAFLGGNFSQVTATTGTDGKAAVLVTAPVVGSYVVTAAISGGDSAVLEDTDNAVAAGVASAKATVTVAAAEKSATEIAAEKAAADAAAAKAEAAKATAAITTVQASITAIQTAISTLVASFTSTLLLLQNNVNKIMKKLGIKK